MSNTRIAQAHKVAISAGGQAASKVSQGHKIILLNVGAVPSRITQGHKVLLFRPIPFATGAIRQGLTALSKVFKGTTPIARVYAGADLTLRTQ